MKLLIATDHNVVLKIIKKAFYSKDDRVATFYKIPLKILNFISVTKTVVKFFTSQFIVNINKKA
jgi:hypothetical protein